MLPLALTACSNNQYSYDENSAPKAMDNFNEADIIDRMTAIKNGLTPKLKPKNQDSVRPKEPAPSANQVQLENLAAQYDSAVVKTNFGDITVKFYVQESPITVNSFMNLAKKSFYNGTKFHRVMKDFMIQGGDPNSKDDDWSNDGQGGPGYQFQDEINQHKLVKGSLAMANSGPNTNGSQFFIVTKDATPWLDGKHTNFGYVVKGMEVVEKIEKVKVNENNHPAEDVIINNLELTKSREANQVKAAGPEPAPPASSTPAVGQEEQGDFKLKE